MAEYAVLLVGVLLIGGGAVKLLGGKLKSRVGGAGDVAMSTGESSGSGSGSGMTSSGSGGGGSRGGGSSSDEKPRATSKSAVGQSTGEQGNNSDNGGRTAGSGGTGGDAEEFGEHSFGLKKSIALAMLVLGLGSVIYFFAKAKKVIKDADEASK